MIPDPETDVTDVVQPELRAISDTFLAQIERLTALEERKRQTPVDDPTFTQLADEVEATARALLARAAAQTDTARQVHAEATADGTSGTIEDIPPGLSAAGILGLWREAERQLAGEVPGSSAARDLERRSAACRLAYQHAWEAARKP